MSMEKPVRAWDEDDDWILPRNPQKAIPFVGRAANMEQAARAAWADGPEPGAPCMNGDTRRETMLLVQTSRNPNTLPSLVASEKMRAAEVINHCGTCAVAMCFLKTEIKKHQ